MLSVFLALVALCVSRSNGSLSLTPAASCLIRSRGSFSLTHLEVIARQVQQQQRGREARQAGAGELT